MQLSIIIVNYNVREFLANLFDTLYKAIEGIEAEIIVVDNASADGSQEYIKQNHPRVILIENRVNAGFSKANNIGLKAATGKYLLLLNPDTLVREDTFRVMMQYMEQDTSIGMAGCKILNPDGTLQLACRRSFPSPWVSFCRITGLSALFPHSPLFARYNLTFLDENKSYEVDAISGSFMMVKREVYEKMGGLDESYFMYGEDLDWCLRVQKAGYKVHYVHSTQIIHYKGESTKRSSIDETRHFYNAMHLFVKKNLSGSFLVKLMLRFAIGLRESMAYAAARKTIILSVILDTVFYNLSLYLAEHTYILSERFREFPDFALPVVYTIPVIIHLLTSSVMRVYRRDRISVLPVLAATVFSFVFLSATTFFFKDFAYSRGVLIQAYVYIFFLLIFWRAAIKLFAGFGNETLRPRIRTLIIGEKPEAEKLVNRLSGKFPLYHTLVGVATPLLSETGEKIQGTPVIGHISNIPKIVKEHRISEIIFCPPGLSYNRIMSIISENSGSNIEFRIAGGQNDFLVGKHSVTLTEDVPLIEISYNISLPVNKAIKFVFDYTFASIIFLLVLPLTFGLALLRSKKGELYRMLIQVPEILKGRKSFVGPAESEYLDGLYVGKPGITGLWFLEGREDEAKLNLYYAKNQNVWLDLDILGKTVLKTLKQQ
ncbi:MAG: hypothetical protein FMNOHCHN_02214 [Ignavibacteriaceae bacterium]|nr:hypothetical protein [Ignavibacteriaceae bacterium]